MKRTTYNRALLLLTVACAVAGVYTFSVNLIDGTSTATALLGMVCCAAVVVGAVIFYGLGRRR